MDLPPPGPNALELAFRRLLLKCEEHARGVGVGGGNGAAAAAATATVAGGKQGKGGSSILLTDWRVDPKFHCYVDVLREQLAALEGAPPPPPAGARTPPLAGAAAPPQPLPPAPAHDRLPPDVLALYRARVRAISEALRPPDVPAFCVGRASALAGSAIVALRAQQEAAAATTAATAATSAAAAAASASPSEAAPVAASKLLQRPGGGPQPAARRQNQQQAAAAKGAQAAAAGEKQPQQQQLQLSKAAAERISTQQALQDGLAEELLGMTAELKAGALAMQGALRQRGKLVDEAETALDASAQGARAAARRAGEQYRRSRAGFCQTCLVMVAVACVFAGMIVWIKLTSMVGLGSRRRKGWLW